MALPEDPILVTRDEASQEIFSFLSESPEMLAAHLKACFSLVVGQNNVKKNNRFMDKMIGLWIYSLFNKTLYGI